MNLTSLTIMDRYWNYPYTLGWDNRVATSNLRAISQAQPHLESLYLTSGQTLEDVSDSIQASDVPNLVRFGGAARFARTFLNAAARLDHLKLVLNDEQMFSFDMQDPWSGYSIRALSISLNWDAMNDWDDLGSMLARFPETESLCITSTRAARILRYLLSFYCANIASQLHPIRIYLYCANLKSIFSARTLPRTQAWGCLRC